ncbi:MAG: MotA/TolQ/ExbB proton channel family protein, partial [Planctomycetes bacterium]|nr:MotA/TolQ/ExbB proton channel family protein [Planctomycetota bacterium]
LAAARLYESYALIRTITWAVPILGFLGTVIGITLAISNLTPEQLDTSLNAVTSGLGVAFDTTALALALSVVLVFTSFLVERAEQQILARVEDFGINVVLPTLSSPEKILTPFADAEAQAARKLVAETDALIGRQMQLWQEVLESTRSKWVDALVGQKQDFDAALQNGMQTTLTDHAEQLGRVREEFLTAFQHASQELRNGLEVSCETQRDSQTSFRQRMDELWQSVQEDVRDRQDEQRIMIDRLTQTVTERITAWQTQLQESTEAGVEQLGELRRQREVLLKVAAQEENLTRLQDRLNQNLDSLRDTETFEQTMHSLSAAVHLLTAKTHSRAA